MKKVITLLVVFGVALSLGGCFKKNTINQDDSKEMQYATLMDWFKSGKGVKCVMDTPQGEVTVSSQDDKVRIDGLAYADMSSPATAGEMQTGTSLTDGDWIYIWSGENGMKMNIEEMNKISEEMGSDERIDPEDYSWESWVNDQEEMDVVYECSEQKFSDGVFMVPSNVEFKDLGEMMKGLNDLTSGLMDVDMMGGSAGGVPGFEGSQGMNQEEIEKKLEELMGGAGIE